MTVILNHFGGESSRHNCGSICSGRTPVCFSLGKEVPCTHGEQTIANRQTYWLHLGVQGLSLAWLATMVNGDSLLYTGCKQLKRRCRRKTISHYLKQGRLNRHALTGACDKVRLVMIFDLEKPKQNLTLHHSHSFPLRLYLSHSLTHIYTHPHSYILPLSIWVKANVLYISINLSINRARSFCVFFLFFRSFHRSFSLFRSFFLTLFLSIFNYSSHLFFLFIVILILIYLVLSFASPLFFFSFTFLFCFFWFLFLPFSFLSFTWLFLRFFFCFLSFFLSLSMSSLLHWFISLPSFPPCFIFYS